MVSGGFGWSGGFSLAHAYGLRANCEEIGSGAIGWHNERVDPAGGQEAPAGTNTFAYKR